jgi:hypothetical protein
LQSLTETELENLDYAWWFWGRDKQLAPPGEWLTWLVRAGRGFGKTRTGAQWCTARAREHPGRWIALIAKTPADARDYMIEGPGGFIKNTEPSFRPEFQSTKRRLVWPNGSWGTVYSAEEPDQLRGFSGDTAWLDEFAKYRNPGEVWDALQFGMREASDDQPRTCITTTPRPIALLSELENDPTTVTVVGSSYENRANLSQVWFDKTLAAYEGTQLGDQEIHAKILTDVEGRVYSSFSKARYPVGNIDPTIVDRGVELLVGIDFNVHPMSAVIAQRNLDECEVLDAIQLKVSNTQLLADEIKRLYPGRYYIACPDPSGQARKTSAPVGQTDMTILRDAGFEVRAPRKAPLIVDRVNNSNAMYLQGTRRRARIHPRAERLVTALNSLTYKKGTSLPDKTSGYDHICDAEDYLFWQEFNVLGKRNRPNVHVVRI